MVARTDRLDAVLKALAPICPEPHDLVEALSDTLVHIYIVGSEDMTDRTKMEQIVELFSEKTFETYDGFMASKAAMEMFASMKEERH